MPETLVAFALALRIATVLQGEGGIIGRLGMVAVADTLLARREAGQSWEQVLGAYYGNARPTGAAREIAEQMLAHPWKSQGMQFCFSEQDRVRMGWPEGDVVLRRGRWALHLRREWPGGEGA